MVSVLARVFTRFEDTTRMFVMLRIATNVLAHSFSVCIRYIPPENNASQLKKDYLIPANKESILSFSARSVS